jgi:hypothetical protein
MGANNGFVAQWLSVLCSVGILYLRARVRFLLCASLLFGNARAVRLVWLILVNPAVNLSGGNLGIPGVNLVNESCRITSIKGWYIQKMVHRIPEIPENPAEQTGIRPE